MQANTNTRQPQQLLAPGAHFAIAAAVAVLVSLAWIGAERESRDAVLVTSAAIAGHVTHVTLPTVEVVGRRTSHKTAA